MAILKIFHGIHCNGRKVRDLAAEKLGYKVALDDAEIVKKASERYGVAEKKLLRAMTQSPSVWNKYTHEKERFVSHLRMVMADLADGDGIVVSGYCSHLVPRSVTHALGVCVIAEFNHRCKTAAEAAGLSQKEATRLIHKDDESKGLWTDYLFGKEPWDADLYDVLIPTDKTSVEKAVELILSSAGSSALAYNDTARAAAADFKLMAKVEEALVNAGHNVMVAADKGATVLTINKNTLMLARLEDELKKIAGGVSGVESVETKVGPGFYKADIYRRFEPEVPSKVLLVDDEREFVQTLSERLQLRDVGSTVVYDGQQALDLVEDDEPDVIVLDLNMPGINGMEVLRRLKKDKPHIEVIVLTGHGSEKDRETALDLGAFAYLQKPVDIEELSKTMKEAQKKYRRGES